MARWELTVALRYLWMARKRAHSAFLTIISTSGLAVGVATLLISLALLSGLQGEIKQRMILSSPLLLIEPSTSNTIGDASKVEAAASSAGLHSIHGIVTGMAWASGLEGRGQPLRIRSFDATTIPRTEATFGRHWQIDDVPESIYMTRDSSAGLGLSLGDSVTIVSPRSKLTPFGPVPVWRKYKVTRLVIPEHSSQPPDAFLPFAAASRLFDTSGLPTSIEIFGPANLAEASQKRLASLFPDLLVKTWKEINRPLFLALRLEKTVMFATISLIIFVAALNLISSLSMMIVEKRPQVGVLRTLGASERGILVLFLSVGLSIGLMGTVAGNVIGLGVSWAADHYRLVPLPGDYYVSYVPFKIDLSDVIGVNIVAVILSAIATWYPARVAARLDPIAAIRDE